MSDPSGEKRGSVSTPGVAVSRRAEPPFRPTTQRSPAYSKATRSLLTAGWRSSRVPWPSTAAERPAVKSSVVSSLVNMKLFVSKERGGGGLGPTDEGYTDATDLLRDRGRLRSRRAEMNFCERPRDA